MRQKQANCFGGKEIETVEKKRVIRSVFLLRKEQKRVYSIWLEKCITGKTGYCFCCMFYVFGQQSYK